MTIDEAIKILTLDLAENFWAEASQLEAALKLGIEALKWFRDERGIRGTTKIPWLPGETEK